MEAGVFLQLWDVHQCHLLFGFSVPRIYKCTKSYVFRTFLWHGWFHLKFHHTWSIITLSISSSKEYGHSPRSSKKSFSTGICVYFLFSEKWILAKKWDKKDLWYLLSTTTTSITLPVFPTFSCFTHCSAKFFASVIVLQDTVFDLNVLHFCHRLWTSFLHGNNNILHHKICKWVWSGRCWW